MLTLKRQQQLEELQQRKNEITKEITRLYEEFGPESPGCLELEDVYSTRNGKKFGPFGPYFYRYYYVQGKRVKQYVGKQATDLKIKQEALARIKELEKQYKSLLKEERRLFTTRVEVTQHNERNKGISHRLPGRHTTN